MTGQQTRVVHCKKERFDVYIGRPSKWGNPFTHLADRKTKAEFIVRSREEAIRCYEEYLFSSGLIADIEELKGKVLGCWCCPKACHGDVLARLLGTHGTHSLKAPLRQTSSISNKANRSIFV